MRTGQAIGVGVTVLVGVALAALLVRLPAPETGGDHSHAHDEHHADEHHDDDAEARGPRGGRILRDGRFAAEVTIHEHGVPPEFRVYVSADGAPLPPATVDLTIELRRLGGDVEMFHFEPGPDHLRSTQTVGQPHSFDVTVVARHAGEAHRWEYGTYEGRVELAPEAVRAARIEIETAGPATVQTTLSLPGQIVPNEDRMAHMIPRFPGVVKEARKRLGDPVEQGEVLAVVQSNQSLQSYEVRSEISGTVIKKHVTPGEFVDQGEDVYVVADLGTVWVDLNVYRQDFARLRVGQRVLLDAGDGVPQAEGTIGYISPFGAPNTQTMLARVELPNPTGAWRPGLFVTGEVIVERATVPSAVRATALQTMRDRPVVFLHVNSVFEAQPVEIGRRDAEFVEVLSGIAPGQEYAARNSFVLKAELGKAGVSHSH
jgi:cobalt-zinc-cadmium efflux system membrane fusion protein